MYRPVLLFLLVALTCSPARRAGAQGWVRPAGGYYVKTGVQAMRTTRFFERGGNVIDIPTLGHYAFSVYGEYGFTRRLTGIAYLPIVERITLARQVGARTGFEFFPGDTATRPGDAETGVRYGLRIERATVLSAGLTLGIPTGQSDQQNGLVNGDGEFNQMVYLGAGHSFWPVPVYVTGSAGYNLRHRGYSDEIHARAEIGGTWWSRVTTLVRVSVLESRRNGDASISGGTGGLGANDQEYVVLGTEAGISLGDGFGIALGVEGALRAERTLSGRRWSLGLYRTSR